MGNSPPAAGSILQSFFGPFTVASEDLASVILATGIPPIGSAEVAGFTYLLYEFGDELVGIREELGLTLSQEAMGNSPPAAGSIPQSNFGPFTVASEDLASVILATGIPPIGFAEVAGFTYWLYEHGDELVGIRKELVHTLPEIYDNDSD